MRRLNILNNICVIITEGLMASYIGGEATHTVKYHSLTECWRYVLDCTLLLWVIASFTHLWYTLTHKVALYKHLLKQMLKAEFSPFVLTAGKLCKSRPASSCTDNTRVQRCLMKCETPQENQKLLFKEEHAGGESGSGILKINVWTQADRYSAHLSHLSHYRWTAQHCGW